MTVLLVHSKSNAYENASRRRLSLNFSRLVLKNQPWAPEGVAAGLEAPDLVGAVAERRLERGLVERMGRVIGAREDRQACNEQRHVAGALRSKSDDHAGVVDRFRAEEVAQLDLGDRMAFLLED